jgi:actin-like protein 6A
LQLMFEKFETPAAFLCKSSVLTAFSAGRSTACVVESGAGHTTVAPIHDGYVVTKGVRRTHMSGSTLDDVLEKILTQQHGEAAFTPAYQLHKTVDSSGQLHINRLNLPATRPSFHLFQCRELFRELKESLCRLGESSFDSSQKFPTVAYELPDGKTIEIGNERFIVPEHLFNPKYSGLADSALSNDFDQYTFRGVQHMVLESVESVDVDLRKDLYGNVVLSGGNTLFPGTPNRLTKEIGGILSAAHKVKVVGGASINDRKFGVWIGGSILASLGSFHQMWISKAEYEEQGATLLAAKCP